MNNKGFTLMELLAVILILAVVSVSATLAFGNIDSTTAQNELKNKYIEIQRAASLYVDLNDDQPYLDELTVSAEKKTIVSVGTLKSNNYINNLDNPVNGEEISTDDIVIIYLTDEGHVDTCIIESNYDSGSEVKKCVANSKGEWLDMSVDEDKSLFDVKTEGMNSTEKEEFRNKFCCNGNW